MNERLVDFLLWVAGTALVGWGAYEVYKPLGKVAIGMAMICLVYKARSGK